jgi:putative transport protein
LLLGSLGRTGPIVWTLPYSASLTLRQIGLILFLAGVGTRAGYGFFSYVRDGHGLAVLAGGAFLTAAIAAAALAIGHLLFRIPFGVLAGMLAGLQTQPAALAFAIEEVGDESPNVGYATVYPVATLMKVLLGQLLVGPL